MNLFKRIVSEENFFIIDVKIQLLRIYVRQGPFEEAEELGSAMLARWENVSDKNAISRDCFTKELHQRLVGIYLALKGGKEAEELQLKLHSLQYDIHGEKYPSTISTMGRLA